MARDDFYASLFGAAYSFYMEHPLLGLPIGRIVWGGDSRPYYESMATIREAPAAATIVDCPCGAGPALRALPAAGSQRYVGVDLSPSMLARARRRAAARGLDRVELVAADATAIPLPDSSAGMFLSLWGLHCFDDPAAAMREAARVLEPGGRLIGATFIRGRETLRQRLLIRPHRGDFGPIGTQAQTEAWLEAAGFATPSLRRSGPMLFFEGRLPE